MKPSALLPKPFAWLLAAAALFVSASAQLHAADAKALQLSYHQHGKAIVDAIIAKKIEIADVQKHVDAMLTDSAALAKLYAAKHPAGTKLLGSVTAAIPEMRKLSFGDLEKQWHDLEHFKAPGNDPGIDLSNEDNEHFTDPIHTIVHPLLVLRAAQDFVATKDEAHLKTMKEEIEEGLEQAEKTRDGILK